VATNDDPLLKRVQSSYQRLTAVASKLNDVSDELGVAINSLDEALKQLNLGITHWHKFAGNDHEGGSYWANYLGYAKIGTRWGIALSKTSGHYDAPPEYNKGEEWLFNDAPRQLRMDAVDHIPAMIDALITAAEEAVARIEEKTVEAKKLAELLTPGKAKSGQRR
jgi:hypothetical protein